MKRSSRSAESQAITIYLVERNYVPTMIGAALQRFATLVALLGIALELGSSGTGIGVLLFALLIGVTGLVLELRPQLLET